MKLTLICLKHFTPCHYGNLPLNMGLHSLRSLLHSLKRSTFVDLISRNGKPFKTKYWPIQTQMKSIVEFKWILMKSIWGLSYMFKFIQWQRFALVIPQETECQRPHWSKLGLWGSIPKKFALMYHYFLFLVMTCE